MELVNNKISITEALGERLKSLYIEELNVALDDIRKGICSNELIDSIESIYEFNIQKLGEAKNLEKLSIAKRKKFLQTIAYIETVGLSDANTLSTILTSASILSLYDEGPENLKEENLYLLASSFISIPLKNYEIYKGMVDDEVLDSIRTKATDYFEMRNICYNLLDYCEMTESKSIKDLKNVISRYENKNQNRIK